MATYFLNLKAFGRSNGSSAPGAAAYRAGERIRDERTGRLYDHTGRQDVLHKEILVPSEYAGLDMSWAKDRANLWNAAEAAESRKNARVAREFLVALPVELDLDGRVGLARDFAKELADRYRFAVDVVVHAPRDFPGSDPRNFHAHLLATTREVDRNGFGAKTTFELGESTRKALGLGPSIEEFLRVRERWAAVTNEALREAHIEARIDHRSLRAQGIDREPRPWIPKGAFEAERRGYYSPVAERMRADYQAREQARLEQSREPLAPGQAISSIPEEKAARPPSLEDVQRQSAEKWRRAREESAERPPENARSRGRDNDFSL
ncbi:MAG: MobA/MobL family protein [Steroidobacteraceae bacterium]|jgi:ATP-dependent exoDNAse (exonuclease V) alpha subunit